MDYRRKSGGIGIYVKDYLSKHITFNHKSTEYILWIAIDEQVTNLPEKLMLGIYIPPENSRFFTNENFELFEDSVSDICNNYKYVMITDDANSRTAQLHDFVRPDSFLFDFFDVEADDQNDFEKHTVLQNLSIPLNRQSMDNKTNAHGIRLIELCRNNNLFIFNGRIHNDLTGKYTFKDKSVIDYTIATADCFQFIRDFDVKGTDSLFSDGHSLLQFMFETQSEFATHKINLPLPEYKPSCWQAEKLVDFIANIDPERVESISAQLNSYPHSLGTIEHITNEIVSLFDAASNSAFTSFHARHVHTCSDNKPWFGSQCNRARKKYHRAKRKYNLFPTNLNKRMLNKTSKEYKRVINFHISKYKHSNANKLRHMSSNRPKHYWKLLNKLKPKSRDNNNYPSLHDFYEYYKNINGLDTGESQSSGTPLNADVNLELNMPISLLEIERCIQNLKNGKACSPIDKILNQYIKYSKDLILPLLTKLFNCVFDTGLTYRILD